MTSEINQVSSGGVVLKPAPTSAQTMGVPLPKATNTALNKPSTDLSTPAKSSFNPQETRQNVKEAVSFLNEQLSANSRGIGFTINDGNSTPIVTVRNTKTGEVVRQIPNEVVIKIAQNIDSSKGAIEDKIA
jgi:flagellar protein FlaG